jgi:Protein of unknown function (DUF1302)
MSIFNTINTRAGIQFVACFLLIHISISANAVGFEKGDVYGSWDSTASFGTLYRVQPIATDLIGRGNGGGSFSTNGDDGNLNYSETGLVSRTLKITSELELNYKNYGAFVRATGFQDNEANSITGDTQRTPLSDSTIRLNGENISLLDAYVWGDFELGSMPFSLRVGEQVVSWGESTFIQNSINVINPVDVSKLRVPGAELKEALTPVGIVFASLGLTDDVTLEAYWQYDYERTLIDPTGSYFSTNDFAGTGGNFVTLSSAFPDYVNLGAGLIPLTDVPAGIPAFLGLPGTALTAGRSPDVRPDQGDEYGVALRLYSEELNNTEFGFYHVKYHSRLPVINAIASGVNAPPFNNPAAPATYFISYPEDINLFGASFNTQLGNSGIALQGEYSFRDDAPFQVDENEILAAALHFDRVNAACLFFAGGECTSQLGVFGDGAVIPGYIERDVSQVQMTATKIFGNVLKANQAILIGEFAITHVHDMPSTNELRLDAAGTNRPGNPFTAAVLAGGIGAETNDYADATSWGYRIVGRLTYNNAIGPVNLSPRIGWRHDVNGNTPGPGGNFIEGFKQVTLGITADYQNSWKADLSYTGFYGAGTQNLLQDRNFAAFNVSYSF